MSVRKPIEKSKAVDIDALIQKGAKVKEDNVRKKKIVICLALPNEMLEEINITVSKRVGISRTGWIMEAIHEKLRKNDV